MTLFSSRPLVLAVALISIAPVIGAPVGSAAAQDAAPPSPHTDVLTITEIMYNPDAVYDSRGEWIEIRNDSGSTVSLDGWTLGDDTYDTHVISGLSVAAGQRAVLARFGDRTRNGGVDADYVYGDSIVLFNNSDRIVLRDTSGALVDQVPYGDAGFPRTDGHSLSLASSGGDNSIGAAWCVSTTTLPAGDFGSPGAPNECGRSAAELVITEIMNNPAAVDDSVGEWFELTNTGSASVDLVGFSVQDEDGESFRIVGSQILDPGDRAVLGTNADRTLNGDVAIDVDYGDAIRLNNTLDELIVNDTAGIQVDAVRWDDGRTFPDPSGASMELADPSADNTIGANWCVATRGWGTLDRGTPAEAGSCAAAPPAAIMITEIMFDPSATVSERNGEWFELANVGATTAVLDGSTVRTRTGEFVIGSLTIDVGGRAVLASSDDPAANGGIEPDATYDGALALYNGAGLLELTAPDGSLVDRVAYSVRRGFPMVPGHSLELRDADNDVDNTIGANWCSAQEVYGSGDHGTPGTAGVCADAEPAPPLLISEVMRNPAATIDPLGEWVEIYNPTADPVDLQGWQLGDHGSDRFRISESLVIDPDGFVVIGRSGLRLLNGGLPVDLAVGVKMVLVDRADEVVLMDPSGRVVDEVTWDETSLLPRPNGATIQRTMSAMRARGANDDPSGWCTAERQFGAGDRGTPGEPNDCSPTVAHPVVINEIHRDPGAEPDSQAEWIELHNTGAVAVDLSGWHLLDDDVDAWTVPAGVPPIAPGGYLTLGRNGADLNGGIALDVLYGAEIILFNTEDELILLDQDRAVVDHVAWTATNGFPKVRGASMALRDPALDNSVGANWCASVSDQGNGDFGTPGAANVCEIPDDESGDDGSSGDGSSGDGASGDGSSGDGESTGGDEPPNTAAIYAVYAGGATDCSSEVKVHASDLRVGAPIRAGGNLSVSGSSLVFGAGISYGGELALGSGAVTTTVVHEPDVGAFPYDWTVEEFLPGGAHDNDEGYVFHDDDLKINGNGADLPAGLHVVAGDVSVTSGTALLNGVTIIATGTIKIHTSQIALSPFSADLPTLMSGHDKCNGDGISLSASSMTVSGAVVARGSGINVSGSMFTLDGGSLAGGSVNLSGSRMALDAPLAPAG